MPKYISRIQFENMKVLRKRGSSIKKIAKAVGVSEPCVSRNLKYNSYEDYCTSMYAKNSRGQKKINDNSGECRTVGKTCHKCGKAKMLSEFDKKKKSRDGYSTICKECRKAYQREWGRKRKAAEEELEAPKFPEDKALEEFVEKLKRAPQPRDNEPKGINEVLDDLEFKTPEGTKIPKFDIGDRVCIRAGFNMSAYGVINKLLESPDNTTYYEVKYRVGGLFKKTRTLIAGEDVIYKVIKEE